MSILLNNAIFGLLKANTGITKIVGQNIFPVIVPQTNPPITSPCIVIRRNFNTNYTKDGQALNNSTVEVSILSADYNDTITLAILIDNTLNYYRRDVAINTIVDCRLVDCNELWQEDSFIQNLTYAIKNLS